MKYLLAGVLILACVLPYASGATGPDARREGTQATSAFAKRLASCEATGITQRRLDNLLRANHPDSESGSIDTPLMPSFGHPHYNDIDALLASISEAKQALPTPGMRRMVDSEKRLIEAGLLKTLLGNADSPAGARGTLTALQAQVDACTIWLKGGETDNGSPA